MYLKPDFSATRIDLTFSGSTRMAARLPIWVLEALDRVRWALDNRPDRVADLASDARVTLRT